LDVQYGLFFASAGHAALIDYPHAKNLQKIASDVWNKGGIVSSVYVNRLYLIG
jgi:putative intracellular protease/amidase